MSSFSPTAWMAGRVVVRWDDAAVERVEATLVGAWTVEEATKLVAIVREAGRQAWVDLPLVLRGEVDTLLWEELEARDGRAVVVDAEHRPADPTLTAWVDWADCVRIWDAPWLPAPDGFQGVPEWSASRVGLRARQMALAGVGVRLAPTGEAAMSRLVASLRPPAINSFRVVFERGGSPRHELVAKVPRDLPGRTTPPRPARLAAALKLVWLDR